MSNILIPLFKTLLVVTIFGFVSNMAFAHRSYYKHHHPRHHAPKQVVIHPRHGHRYYSLPRGYRRLIVGTIPFFYRGGVFLRHLNNEYVVVQAPIGVVVQSLPNNYSIIFIQGKKYYVTDDDTHYIKVKDGYQVTSVPEIYHDDGMEAIEPEVIEVPSANPQDKKTPGIDRYECHRWGVSQSNYDPTLEDIQENKKKKQSYRLAVNACLKKRGYD